MNRNWSHERWRKQYLREPLQERLWSVMARGLREYLRMVAEDDGTVLSDVDDPIAALIRALGPEPNEEELFGKAVGVLLESGFLVHDEGRLWIPSLPDSQEWPRAAGARAAAADGTLDTVAAARRSGRSSTERVRAHRARRRAEAAALAVSSDALPVTESVSLAVSGVAAGVSCNAGNSRGVRKPDPLDQTNSQKDFEIDHLLQTRAGVSARVVSGVTPVSESAAVSPVSGEDNGEDEHERSNDGIEAALASPVQERAALIVEHPDLARRLKPHTWPEVVAVATALAQTEGQQNALLSDYERDRGVRNLVSLYASGVPQRDLEHVARTVPKQIWWTESDKRLGLESLSINVVRRNRPKPLARVREPSRRVAEVLAWLEREKSVG